MAPGSRSRTPSLRRQSQPVSPLPMIAEDAADPPTLPERSPRRTRLASTPVMPSQLGGLNRGGSTSGSERPAYSTPRGPSPTHLKSEGPPIHHDEHRQGIMERMARRGERYKLILITILLVGIIIGLAVGLTLGLRKRHHRHPSPLPTDIFPAGKYAFTTALTNILTGCLPDTISPAAWNCVPSSIYNSSAPDLSSTTFHWIIEPVSRFSEYVISSSPPPPPPPPPANKNKDQQQHIDDITTPHFTNLSLTLLDSNQYTERFTFTFTMTKAVPVTSVPTTSINNTTNSSTTPNTLLDTRQQQQEPKPQITCYHNATRLTATIWTRMRATYPSNITAVPAPVNASRASFAPWPFRVEVREDAVQQQQQGGGDETTGLPDCRDGEGRSVNVSVPVSGSGLESRRLVDVDGLARVRRRQGGGDDNRCLCLYGNYRLVDSDLGVSSQNETGRGDGVKIRRGVGEG